MPRTSENRSRDRLDGQYAEPRFGNISKHSLRRPVNSGETDFAAIQESDDFVAIRRRFRWFVFPVTLLVLAWYFTYVALGAYAEEFMSRQVYGYVNMGIVLGLLQFVTTAIVTVLYGRYVRKRIDPLVDRLREQEGADR
ncbi:DUF485 domain-containing protein [Saccharopolyspora sp. NPDC047091]|uniref:DUF485 domain-containing protein n=1 Tax=Saccharopolyspora sp. NPDC047091 TaxID=3155924 RepID=UPI0033E2C06F